ncbi:helix-turn-helix domain-containing protein [Rossellomorea marisflavi]|uniref:helix-turn-helix domain-containing protein n=1 Tax=Rossellomorea marisflavi TaxID=189381 RepID=UPI003B58B3F4
MQRTRRSKDITIRELSVMTGISLNYLSQIENGKKNPSLKKLTIIFFTYKLVGKTCLSVFDEILNVNKRECN